MLAIGRINTALAILIGLTITAASCGGSSDSEEEAAAFEEIDVARAKQLIDENTDLVVVDVSPLWKEGHLPGAVNYPVGDGSLEKAIPSLDKSKPHLVYCHSDAPAIQGAQMLVDAGFETVYRLEGNYQAWKDAGYQVEKGDENGKNAMNSKNNTNNKNDTNNKMSFSEIDTAEAKQLIEDKADLVIIDVSPYWDDGHIPGSVSHPIGDGSLEKAIPSLDKSRPYLVYCHADGPAIRGAQMLVDAGFGMVYRLKGNYQAWKDAGYDIEK